MTKILKVLSFPGLLICCLWLFGPWTALKVSGGETLTFEVGPGDGEQIGNRFSGINYWHYSGTTPEERAWHEDAESMPENWVKEHYPWMEEVRLLTSLGGSYLHYRGSVFDVERSEFDRDLFKDPDNWSVTDDYDFEPLVRACRNILRQGLRPIVKFHGVPIKLSEDPHIGWFRVNVRPPADYDEYAGYMEACVQALIDAFGVEEVRTWRWITHTEMNNPQMLKTADGDPEKSKQAYFRIYDMTYALLSRLLEEEHLEIASHGYEGGFWDERDFLEYVFSDAEPVSEFEKGKSTFYAVSYYDVAPRNPNNLGTFDETIHRIREKLEDLGQGDLPIEIGEGGLVFGWDQHWLWHGLALGGEFDLTWTALSFKKLLDNNVRAWPRWPSLRTYGLFSGIETLSTHLLRLIYRMRDDELLQVRCDQSLVPEEQFVDAVGGFDREKETLHLLAFNHKTDLSDPKVTIPVQLEVDNFFHSNDLEVKVWRLDRDNGDFWHQWEKDREAHGITRANYMHNRSMDQIYVQNALHNPEDIQFWYSKEDAYKQLAQFPCPQSHPYRIENGQILLDYDLDCFSVVFFEIRKK